MNDDDDRGMKKKTQLSTDVCSFINLSHIDKPLTTSTSALTHLFSRMAPRQQTSSGGRRPPLLKVWFTAARPHTLTASIAPNIVSYFAGLAHIVIPNSEGKNHSSSYRSLIVEWTLFCMLIQLGTNLHNDYADFVRGADNDRRVGQARATQKGWLTPRQTAKASGQTLLGAFVLGLTFLYRMVQAGIHHTTSGRVQIALMAFIVISSVFNAFAYTGGPWPLGYIGLPTFSIGYAGLGDIFVFLYFGLVATLVPPFLHVVCNNDNNIIIQGATFRDHNSTMNGPLLLLRTMGPYSIQVAALATNIIIVNNLRDRDTDILAAKRTLAVRFGPTFCRVEYGIMLLIAYGLVLHDYYNFVEILLTHDAPQSHGRYLSLVRLLPFLSIPLAWREWQAIYTKDGSALNQHVGGAAMVQFLFCILLGISIYLSSSLVS